MPGRTRMRQAAPGPVRTRCRGHGRKEWARNSVEDRTKVTRRRSRGEKQEKQPINGRGVYRSGCKELSGPNSRRVLETKTGGHCAEMHLTARRLGGRGRHSTGTRHLASGVMMQVRRGGANKYGLAGGENTRGRGMILTGDVMAETQVARP